MTMRYLDHSATFSRVFAVSESLIGTGKDCSSFITQPVVQCFFRAGHVVLEENTWEGVPEVNQLAMGLPITMLRERIGHSVRDEEMYGADWAESAGANSGIMSDNQENKSEISEMSEILAAKKILNTLSRSGVPEETKPELSEKARKV